jgi:hypothetical protein
LWSLDSILMIECSQSNDVLSVFNETGDAEVDVIVRISRQAT